MILNILSAVLLVVFVAEAAWLILAYTGMLEPVPDLDDIDNFDDEKEQQDQVARLVALERGTSGSESTRSPVSSPVSRSPVSRSPSRSPGTPTTVSSSPVGRAVPKL